MGTYKATARPDAALEEKLRTQVEFYFSDSNLPRDKFLRSRVEADPEGFVDLQLIVTFKRMQQLNATVADVARALTNAELVELSADRLRVRRKKPLPLEDTSKQRSIYVKGYKAGESPLAEPPIEEVVALFEPFGKVLSVRMRRKKTRGKREQLRTGHAERAVHEDDSSSEESLQAAETKNSSMKRLQGEPHDEASPESPRLGALADHQAGIRQSENFEPTANHEDETVTGEHCAAEEAERKDDTPASEQDRVIFKGSVFVEFDSEEAVAKVLQRHTEEPFRVPGMDRLFIIERKDAYLRRKNAETKEARRTRKRQRQQQRPTPNEEPLLPIAENSTREVRGADGESTKTSALPLTNTKPDASVNEKKKDNVAEWAHTAAGSEDEAEASDASDTSVIAETSTFEPGLILCIEGIGPTVDRDDIRNLLSRYGEIGWIDHSRGGEVAHVRFLERDSAARAVGAEATPTLGGQRVQLRILEGPAEQSYWARIWEAQRAIREAEKRKHKREEKRRKFQNKRRKYGRGRQQS